MDIHKIIGLLPKPKKGFVFPNHKYTGPYNPLDEQLDKNDRPIIGQEPYNAVDALSMNHDICYRDKGKTKDGKLKCDDIMLRDLNELQPKDLREKIDKKLVQSIIESKIKLGLGIEWSNELANELHKPIKRNFPKRRVFSPSVDSIWAGDLVDMQSFSRQNKGYKYILMIIDVFSKYGWAVPLKSKTGINVANALKKLFKERIPTKIWFDKGKEIYNKHVNELLEKNNVKLYSTENEEKASVVERWNKTIKTWMWKYFTANNTYNYLNILPSLIDRYNNSYHRSIKCTPNEAIQSKNWKKVHQNLYGSMKDLIKKPKFNVGDKVRISKKKKTFEKGFTPNWTEEVFTISKVKATKPPTYEIEDSKGDEVKGTFYEAELQKSSQNVYRIEKVLRRRKGKALIKWKGYSSDFNSWIPETNITNNNGSK